MNLPLHRHALRRLARHARMAVALAAAAALAPRACRSPPRPARRAAPRPCAPVVELYTSEGCNSCPPADRWLSQLKTDPDVVALAFHVDYWDRLGWKDRFASAAFTARQAEQQARERRALQLHAAGRGRRPRPQGLAGHRHAARQRGRPRRSTCCWRAKASASPRPSPRRPLTEAARRLLGGHRAGPRHRRQGRRERRRDAAARLRGARLPDRAGLVAAQPARRSPSSSSCRRGADAAARPREVNLVVVDADSGRPVQALKRRAC